VNFDSGILMGIAAVLTAIGTWKTRGHVENKRAARVPLATAAAAAREILMDEGENGDATLRAMVKDGFRETSLQNASLERGLNGVREDVRVLWSSVDRQARILREHEAAEEAAIVTLSERFEAALPGPPPGVPERRSGRKKV